VFEHAGREFHVQCETWAAARAASSRVYDKGACLARRSYASGRQGLGKAEQDEP